MNIYLTAKLKKFDSFVEMYNEKVNEYDEKGRVIREEYFHYNGRSMANSDGVIGKDKVYDENGKVTETGITQ